MKSGKSEGTLPGSKGSTLSPPRLIRTTVGWISAELPRAQDESYGMRLLPLSAFATESHRPGGAEGNKGFLIYFWSGKDDDALVRFETRVFGDERVGVGSRFFNCLKIGLDDIASATERKEFGGDAPLIVVLDASGKEVRRLAGWKADAGLVFKGLEAGVKQFNGRTLSAILEKEAKILDTLDRTYWELEDLGRELAENAVHLTKHNCEMGRRKEAEIKEEMATLEAERNAALAEEKALLEPQPGPTSGN